MDDLEQAPSDYAITQAMIRYGGSFVSGLGRLWQRADVVNRARLREAFPDYWREYADPAMHAADGTLDHGAQLQ